MLENELINPSETPTSTADTGPAQRRRRAPAKKAAVSAPPAPAASVAPEPVVTQSSAAPGRRAAKKTAAPADSSAKTGTAGDGRPDSEPVAATATKKTAAKRPPRKPAAAAAGPQAGLDGAVNLPAPPAPEPAGALPLAPMFAAAPTVLFQPPSAENAVVAKTVRPRRPAASGEVDSRPRADSAAADGESPAGDSTEAVDRETSGAPRRRRRGGRGRRAGGGQGEAREASLDAQSSGDQADSTTGERGGAAAAAGATTDAARAEAAGDGRDRSEAREGNDADDREGEGSASSRRRRRRRSRGAGEGELRSPDDPPNTVVRIREPREHEDGSGVQGVKGSTRLEAKKQRRREGREQGRHGRRGLVITESEFLARRESVERVLAVRQRGDRTQIGVLEDGILVEHFVSTASTNRMVGNVYLGRVQNVLSGMEAAFVDIGKGRNAVLYAGEVNFDTSGLEGGPRRIESALKPGQAVVVQVTKDSIGHKGARLTSQVSLPGRYLVYVPEGSMMGISRKLPDVERSRLKSILKRVTPEGAGVIVRTAAEGATEEDLTRDVARLAAQWEDIKKKSESSNAPALLYSEPDLTIRVIRDVFNEDFNSLVVQADTEWDMVEAYVAHVAPDLVSRLSRWTSEEDIFTHYRVDEQIAKALDRKVWLPSGGYLVIDRTEAMIVIDVNTGRFIGKGGNLEETVTKNNLEAAEEIVRQLRLRDIGGIIVIDFIDMVLEGNRDLVLRRLVECLGRDRTKHQVAEVTSLGLVQMTRKRVGNGLLEAFSETCEHCNGRGVIVHTDLVESRPARPAGPPKPGPVPKPAAVRNGRGSRSRGGRTAGVDGAEAVEGAAALEGATAVGAAIAAEGSPAVEGAPVDGVLVETQPVIAGEEAIELSSAGAGAESGVVRTASNGSRSRRGGRRRGSGSGAGSAAGSIADSPAAVQLDSPAAAQPEPARATEPEPVSAGSTE